MINGHSLWNSVTAAVLVFGFSGVAQSADLTVTLVDKKDRAADFAVVTLTPNFIVEEALPGAVTHTSSAMVQEGQQFAPFVVAIKTGEELAFPNKDKIRHHVYSFSKAKKINLPLYGQNTDHSIVFDKNGQVALGCNIHDNMLAYVHVSDAPLRAVAGEDGKVTFTGLPEGGYTLEIWHPDGKRRTNPVVEEIDLITDADLKFTLSLRSRRYQAPPSSNRDY